MTRTTKMEVPFNLNWTVKVKLTEAGYVRLAELKSHLVLTGQAASR
jgi:hypothetical protein